MIGISKEKPIFIEFSLEKDPNERTTEEVIEIVKLLSQIKFLKSFSHNPDFIEVCRHVRLEKYSEGKIIFRQGDPGDKFYIILGGTVGIYVNKFSKSKDLQYMKEITTLEEGGSFGELALIFNATRSASVIAHATTQLIVLDREIFQKYISSQHTENLNNIHGFIKLLRIFEDMSDEDVMKMSSKSLFYKYNSNTLLIRQGEEPNSIFFIRNGMVKLVRKVKFKLNNSNFNIDEENFDDPTPGEIKRGFYKEIDLSIGDLVKGDYFGDHEVLHKQKMSFSVVTTMPTEIILVSTYDIKTIANNKTLEKLIKYMKYMPKDKDLRRAFIEGKMFKNFKEQYLKNCMMETSYKKMIKTGELARSEIKPFKEAQVKIVDEKSINGSSGETKEDIEEEEEINSNFVNHKQNKSLSIITRSISQQIDFFRKQKSIYNVRRSVRLEEDEKTKLRSLKLLPKKVLTLNVTEPNESKLKRTKTFIDIENKNLSPIKMDIPLYKQISEKKTVHSPKNKLHSLLSMEPMAQKNQKLILPKLNLKSTSILEVHDSRFGVFDRNADMFHSLKNILNPYAVPRIFMESRRELFMEPKFISNLTQPENLNSSNLDILNKEIITPETNLNRTLPKLYSEVNKEVEVAVNINSTDMIKKIQDWYDDITNLVSKKFRDSENPLIIKTVILIIISFFALLCAYFATSVIGNYGVFLRDKLINSYNFLFKKKGMENVSFCLGKDKQDHSKEFDVNLLNQTFDQYDRLLRIHSHVDSNTGNKSKNSSFAKSEEEVVDLNKFMKDLGLGEEHNESIGKEKGFIVNFKSIDLLGEEIIGAAFSISKPFLKMSFENELEIFSKELSTQISGYQSQVFRTLSEAEKGCITSAGNNVDKFVDCMMKTSKKLTKQQKMLELRLAFFQQETYECFAKQSQGAKNFAECKQSSKKKLDEYFGRFLKNL